jgi:DNA-binding transcriptional LysR family regulator
MTGQLPFDLASLQLLAAVAETGSLGQAAQRLSISQPAASLRMSTLERRLGLVLLERSPTGSRLTPAGVSVVDWVLPVLDAADALARGVAALRDEREERLRVAASMTVADHLVPAWLVRFHAVQPASAVALRVVNSAAVAALVRDGEADIGFVEGSSAPSGLRGPWARTSWWSSWHRATPGPAAAGRSPPPSWSAPR